MIAPQGILLQRERRPSDSLLPSGGLYSFRTIPRFAAASLRGIVVPSVDKNELIEIEDRQTQLHKPGSQCRLQRSDF